MTLSEILAQWIDEARRMDRGEARAVVVTPELLAALSAEERTDSPVVAGVPVRPAATEVPATGVRPSLEEMVEIAGPDRVSIYVGTGPDESDFPAGHDPSMPVFFVPVPPRTLAEPSALEMYNRLRWYGLGPDEALAGSGG